jgi:hypothetical protein
MICPDFRKYYSSSLKLGISAFWKLFEVLFLEKRSLPEGSMQILSAPANLLGEQIPLLRPSPSMKDWY